VKWYTVGGPRQYPAEGRHGATVSGSAPGLRHWTPDRQKILRCSGQILVGEFRGGIALAAAVPYVCQMSLSPSEIESRRANRLQEIRKWLASQPPVQGDVWLDTLGDRKVEEARFHDHDREGHRDEVSPESSPNRRFYEAALIIHDHYERWMERVAPQAIVLDYACGNGAQTIAAVRAGAAMAVGIDISELSVRNAAESADAAGVGDRTRFLQRDCENTGLPDNMFDAVLCSGMLHHLDLNRAFPELNRILAPGGRILCIEALSYNPVIQLYRNRTPELRTAWEKEHILGMKDVRLAQQWFRVENLRFFLMAAPLATLLPAGRLRRAGIAVGQMVDTVLTRIPGLRLWSWQFSFELVKPR
jgi:SAM-dependent methyltransferase